MAKQIIVTQNNYGILLETQFIDDAKNPIDLTGYSVSVEFEYQEKCFDVLDATIINAEEGRVGVILEQEHTAEIGLYKTQWSVVDDDENVTAQEDIYYFVKKEVGTGEEKEEPGTNIDTSGIADKFKELDETIADKFKELDETLLEYDEKLTEITEEVRGSISELEERLEEDIEDIKSQLEQKENKDVLNLLSFNRYGDIDLPSDFYNNINFRIYRGVDGKINHNFNIDDVINGWRTIYISENGKDTNNGDTQDKPKKTLGTVFSKINALSENNIVIKILSPLLTRNNTNVAITDRIINKNIAIVSDTETNIGSIEPQSQLSWTKNGSCYQTKRSAVFDVWDKKNRDFANKPVQYKKVSTLAECQNTKGSWCLEGSTLYIRRLDDLPIDDDIMVLLQTGSLMFKLQSDVKLIFKNVNFLCTHDLNPNVKIYSDTNKGQFIAVNSNFLGSQVMNGLQIENIKHSWLFNCGAIGTMRDGFNYHNYLDSGENSFAFEFNCVGYNNGIRDTENNNNNATTAHDGYNILRIGCIGFNTKGPVLADVNACYSINYDCTMYDSVLNGTPSVKTAYWFDDAGVTGKTGKSYLINCSGGGKETKGINTDGTAKVNVHNFKGNNVNMSVLNCLE